MGEGRRKETEQDYGLPAGSTFEPAEEIEAVFDLTAPHVMTVLGPVDPASLGVTLHHEHLIRRLDPAMDDADGLLDDPHATLAEVEDFHAAGGGALVDVTTGGEGRDIQALLWVAARAPAHIIATTGCSAVPGTESMSVEERVTHGIQEVRDGIDGTTARSGLVRVGTAGNGETAGAEIRLDIAARIHRETGVPISIRAGDGSAGLEWIAVLDSGGVSPRRVIVEDAGHCLDNASLQDVLERGAFVSFHLAQHGTVGTDAEERLARRIHAWFGLGYGAQVLISPNFARRSLLRAYGGAPGWVYLLERLTLILMEAGLDASLVRQLLVDNAQRPLTIQRGR